MQLSLSFALYVLHGCWDDKRAFNLFLRNEIYLDSVFKLNVPKKWVHWIYDWCKLRTWTLRHYLYCLKHSADRNRKRNSSIRTIIMSGNVHRILHTHTLYYSILEKIIFLLLSNSWYLILVLRAQTSESILQSFHLGRNTLNTTHYQKKREQTFPCRHECRRTAPVGIA